jgi:hypothetical protein
MRSRPLWLPTMRTDGTYMHPHRYRRRHLATVVGSPEGSTAVGPFRFSWMSSRARSLKKRFCTAAVHASNHCLLVRGSSAVSRSFCQDQ